MTDRGNSGIQGTNITITADALAVGAGAKATSSRHTSPEVVQSARVAIEDLRRALQELGLDAGTRTTVTQSMDALASAVAEPQVQPSRIGTPLRSIVAALSSAGVIAGNLTNLAKPLVKLAQLFGLPAPDLG